MPSRVTHDVTRLDSSYEKMMDEIYLLYHNHPTDIPNIPLTDSEYAELCEYNGMVNCLSRNLSDRKRGKSKKVIFHYDPDYSNGLPRRRR